MITAETVDQLRRTLDSWRAEGRTWAFVPTMGALHDGHLALVREALAAADKVVVSVFVNPTQFDRAEDLELYPRQPEADAALLAGVGADLLFLPSVSEVYPDGPGRPRRADLAGLDTRYEGAARPGHFDGVVQVVRRLVDLVRPALMFMGQKDAQQVAIIRRAAQQEFWQTKVVTVPIVREASGLAMSSRNGRLSEAGFAKASLINECLEEAAASYHNSGLPRDIEQAALRRLSQAGFKPEYFDFIYARDFRQLPNLPQVQQAEVDAMIVVVAWIEGVRLIDNRQLAPVTSAVPAAVG